MKTWTHILLSAALAGASLLGGTAFAADPQQAATGQDGKSRAEIAALELQTAVKHAGLAARADDAEATHKHLQHAINCLVSKDDPAYDASAEDPCKQGQGVLQDYAAAKEQGGKTIEDVLKQAKDLAQVGTQQQRYIGATAAAHGVSALLEQAQQEMMVQKSAGAAPQQ